MQLHQSESHAFKNDDQAENEIHHSWWLSNLLLLATLPAQAASPHAYKECPSRPLVIISSTDDTKPFSIGNDRILKLEKLEKNEIRILKKTSGWHVSLTNGFRCIDLRKFYVPFAETTIKPTKTGIALRLDERSRFKQAIANLHRDNPAVSNFVPCFLAQDHTTPQDLNSCLECNAFPSALT